MPVQMAGSGAHVVRQTLTADELAAHLDVVVGLQFRNFAELESRIQTGERIGQAEMEAKYLPLKADFERVASWLEGKGFQMTLSDKSHSNIFVRASVSTIQSTLEVTFARVATAAGEYTSAVSAPTLPSEISGSVAGIEGLQPHIIMHPPQREVPLGTNVGGRVTPSDVLAGYDAPVANDGNGLPITGTGQTIAVIMDATVLPSDLAAFCQAAGTNNTPAKFSTTLVAGGPLAASQTTDGSEAALDVEWVTGMAPGANVRLYAIPSLSLSNMLAACTQIMNDGGVSVVSYSGGGPEAVLSSGTLQLGTQTTAQLAAAGITMVASSGDGGSNPNPVTEANGYSSTNTLSVEYPASDPNVTGVGGTTTTYDANWNASSETVWSHVTDGTTTSPLATGGGISGYFQRPSWQAGVGVPTGSMRCVPDIAAMAEANPLAGGYTGGLTYYNGTATGFVGTSLSTPILAGATALLNQYRLSYGLPNIGLLNRWVYGLIGTAGVYDTLSGTNGAYQASTGYDLCTGVGSPNITQLINLTTKEVQKVGAPTGPVNEGSSFTMSVTPQFVPSSFQWYLNGNAISGATGSTYTVSSAGAGDNGDYSVTITNTQLGVLSYDIGTVSVVVPVTTTRLINISTRAQVGTGGNILIPGFVIGGSGTETLLIRADGPALAGFGVTGILAQPVLGVYNQAGTQIASNTGWGTATNAAQLASTAAAIPTFALAQGSADSALLVTLGPGAYTVQISGSNGTTGVALAEVYEVSYTGTSRLTNISTRALVGTGGNIVIPGFVISGSGTERLLVRADGPSLSQFGVTGILAAPALAVLYGSTVVASNTGWGTDPDPVALSSAAAAVPTFAFTAGSADCAQIVNLTPGAYTVQVSGASNTTGVALAEVYEIP